MGVYEHTVQQINKQGKNNLQEKLRGSNKFEYEKICKLLESKYHTKPQDLMGLGTSCIVYNHDSHYVIKVCAKKIKFFHDRKHRSAYDLQKTAQPLAPFLLPVDSVIYDGDEFFAYLQEKCQPLTKDSKFKSQDLLDILAIVESLLSHGLLVGQLKPKNVGYWKDHLVLFDYHSMHQLYDRIKDKKLWYHSLEESLIKYNQLYRRCDLNPLIEQIKQSKNQDDIDQVITMIHQLKKKLQDRHH
jgi:hypothetical protein